MGVSITTLAGRSGDISAGLRSEKWDTGVTLALTLLRGEGVVVALVEPPGPVLRGEGVFRGEGVADLPRNLAATKSASRVSSSTSSGAEGMNRPPRTPPEMPLLGVPLPDRGGEGVGERLRTMFTKGIIPVVTVGCVGVVSVVVPGERDELDSASGRAVVGDGAKSAGLVN